MIMYNIYWIFYMVLICVAILIAYYWDKIKEHEVIGQYIAFFLIAIYLFCGPFQCIFQTSHDIELAKEYQAYNQQVIIPMEEQYNDALLPDGYYYLGCEIVDMQSEQTEDGIVYTYTFGTVDMDRQDLYQYESYELLNPDVPYLLTMDSLTTTPTTDDVITVVWACVE